MAISKEKEEKIRLFVQNRFWPAYPADLCGGTRKKGAKGEAVKAMIKANPTDDEMDRIMRNMSIQIEYDRKAQNAGEDVYRWPYATTYINQRRYDDDLGGSFSELEQKQKLEGCQTEGCDREVHGPAFRFCTECYASKYDSNKTRKKEQMIKLDMMIKEGESRLDYFRRCKEYCTGTLGFKV